MTVTARASLRRRQVLARGLGFAGAAVLCPRTLATTPFKGSHAVRFAVIADPHHGLAPDADKRLASFAKACELREGLDFAIQIGDFCHPTDDARAFVEQYDAIELPRHHVLGNHDMDKGTKAQAIAHWGMRDRYYAFVEHGVRFIVLDLNHIQQGDTRTDYANANFYVDAPLRSWADLAQLAWLRTTLEAEDLPTVVFSHQPLGIGKPEAELPERQHEVLDILTAEREGRSPVLACFCGHLHVDRAERVRDTHCVCINSASYLWHRGMIPYRDALFAFVTIDPAGSITIEGLASEFADGHPHDDGLALDVVGVAAKISDRKLRL